MLVNMLPGLTSEYGMERRATNSIFVSKPPTAPGPVTTADFTHVILGQLREMLTLAARHALALRVRDVPMLCEHITVIVANRTREKMLRSDARWVVAVMADIHAGRNRAVSEFIGHPRSGRRAVAGLKRAVASVLMRTRPQPTFTRFVYFAPEAFGNGSVPMSRPRCARLRAVESLATVHVMYGSAKHGTAHTAGTFGSLHVKPPTESIAQSRGVFNIQAIGGTYGR